MPPPPPRPVVNVRATDPVGARAWPDDDHLDTATFTCHRRGPTNDSLRVFYRLGGTADNGVDYRQIPHSVLIPAWGAAGNVIVAPLDDNARGRYRSA